MNIEFNATEEYLVSDEVLIVDPSYVIDENKWKTLEELIFQPKILGAGIVELDGAEFFVFKPSEGDGVYTVKKHTKMVDELSCDSGYIAIFLKDEFEKLSADASPCIEVDFSEKILVEIEDGKAVGPLKIYMEDYEEEEESDEDEDRWLED